jgi:hypothetical protein
LIVLSFDNTKTDAWQFIETVLHQVTIPTMSDLDAYDDLPGCCKYDHEMAMNQSGEISDENH